jgi:hypothetical protein
MYFLEKISFAFIIDGTMAFDKMVNKVQHAKSWEALPKHSVEPLL